MARPKKVQVSAIAQAVTLVMHELDNTFLGNLPSPGWSSNHSILNFEYVYRETIPPNIEVLIRPKGWPKRETSYIQLKFSSFGTGWALDQGKISAPHLKAPGQHLGFFLLNFKFESPCYRLGVVPTDINTPAANFVLELNRAKGLLKI